MEQNPHLQQAINTAKALMAPGKGLLAMDESTGTANKRFAENNIPQTPEMRRQYRELIVTAPNLGNYISGAILYDETVRQHLDNGSPFVPALVKAGIIPGIKVDEGTVDMPAFPGEKITEGLDGLRDRLKEYAGLGLRFAKWRAVIKIDKGIPTSECIDANMFTLARYAALCQEAGLMPIVEPEVLMDGDHTLERCFEITERTQKSLFRQLYKQRVALEGILLKPNMVLPGLKAATQNNVEEVADATIKCLLHCVPAAVPGVAFLSGGQSSELASARLNEMNKKYKSQLPWVVTFSYSRAIQSTAMEIWKGDKANKVAAQQELVFRASCNGAARKGEYSPDMEKQAAQK